MVSFEAREGRWRLVTVESPVLAAQVRRQASTSVSEVDAVLQAIFSA